MPLYQPAKPFYSVGSMQFCVNMYVLEQGEVPSVFLLALGDGSYLVGGVMHTLLAPCIPSKMFIKNNFIVYVHLKRKKSYNI